MSDDDDHVHKGIIAYTPSAVDVTGQERTVERVQRSEEKHEVDSLFGSSDNDDDDGDENCDQEKCERERDLFDRACRVGLNPTRILLDLCLRNTSSHITVSQRCNELERRISPMESAQGDDPVYVHENEKKQDSVTGSSQ